MRTYANLIGGSFVAPLNDRYFDAIDPYVNKSFARVPESGEEDAEVAITAAAAAFDSWRRVPGVERARMLRRLAELLNANAVSIGRVESRDNGKLVSETVGQARFAARAYEFFAGSADRLTGRTIPLDDPNLFDFTRREPAGVAVLITAWNSPMQLLSNKLAPALAAGCTVVVKPSEQASCSTLEFAELISEAGFPPGVVNVVTGGADVGRALVADARVGRISFTGSVGAGRAIARSASRNLTPCTLELGGKSPNIVFADADLDRALRGAMSGIFGAGGQTCVAGSRLLVQDSVYDGVVEALARSADKIVLGDPAAEATQMGPMANESQRDRVVRMIREAKDQGAVEATGSARDLTSLDPAFFVQPTIFRNVSNDMTIAREEVFGPVLSVIPFKTEQDAIEIANDTDFGLAAGLWTTDLARAHRVARDISAGTVWINTYRTAAIQAPFGGLRRSGYGRERGEIAIEEYLTTKNVMVDLGDVTRDHFDMADYSPTVVS
ncbi:aldehyde dehydrogenase [Streptomyces prunicolor]|uniref:aldehyde dehydrogenase n=1 Tax=Streptomyces prunicolor TaxID=67348 RepID=UPI000369AA7B|nr:aldehyde dehydrogenase [Streptomyces prunicolor]